MVPFECFIQNILGLLCLNFITYKMSLETDTSGLKKLFFLPSALSFQRP